MMLIGVFAKDDRYSANYIANYANVYVLDALKRVAGRRPGADHGRARPGDADLDEPGPHGLARHHDQPTSPTRSSQQNALFGAGQIGQQPTAGPVELTFPVVTQAPFTDPRQYENIILRASQDGSAIVRVGDVARAEIGLQQYIVDSKLNGVPATFIAVYQQPGANGLKVSKARAQDAGGDEGALPRGHRLRRSRSTPTTSSGCRSRK